MYIQYVFNCDCCTPDHGTGTGTNPGGGCCLGVGGTLQPDSIYLYLTSPIVCCLELRRYPLAGSLSNAWFSSRPYFDSSSIKFEMKTGNIQPNPCPELVEAAPCAPLHFFVTCSGSGTLVLWYEVMNHWTFLFNISTEFITCDPFSVTFSGQIQGNYLFGCEPPTRLLEGTVALTPCIGTGTNPTDICECDEGFESCDPIPACSICPTITRDLVLYQISGCPCVTDPVPLIYGRGVLGITEWWSEPIVCPDSSTILFRLQCFSDVLRLGIYCDGVMYYIANLPAADVDCNPFSATFSGIQGAGALGIPCCDGETTGTYAIISPCLDTGTGSAIADIVTDCCPGGIPGTLYLTSGDCPCITDNGPAVLVYGSGYWQSNSIVCDTGTMDFILQCISGTWTLEVQCNNNQESITSGLIATSCDPFLLETGFTAGSGACCGILGPSFTITETPP